MKPSTSLVTAAVLTALAACANPVDGVAQAPQTQPPAERSTQTEKDDLDMAAAKQAADTMQAAWMPVMLPSRHRPTCRQLRNGCAPFQCT